MTPALPRDESRIAWWFTERWSGPSRPFGEEVWTGELITTGNRLVATVHIPVEEFSIERFRSHPVVALLENAPGLLWAVERLLRALDAGTCSESEIKYHLTAVAEACRQGWPPEAPA